MKTNGYILSAAALIVVVYLIYFLQFYVVLDYEVSDDAAVWGQLGDYVGGVLNPFFGFVTLVLLIKSLSLQNEANRSLRAELKNTEKTEKLRSFEVLFFSLINAQKNLFESFSLDFSEGGELIRLSGAEAVMKVEADVEEARKSGVDNEKIREYLDDIDKNDQMFGLFRSFYVIVKIIYERLSESEGFSSLERKVHFLSLVNLTEFSQLRMYMMYIQFMDYDSCEYMRTSLEFRNTVEEVGLGYELY